MGWGLLCALGQGRGGRLTLTGCGFAFYVVFKDVRGVGHSETQCSAGGRIWLCGPAARSSQDLCAWVVERCTSTARTASGRTGEDGKPAEKPTNGGAGRAIWTARWLQDRQLGTTMYYQDFTNLSHSLLSTFMYLLAM